MDEKGTDALPAKLDDNWDFDDLFEDQNEQDDILVVGRCFYKYARPDGTFITLKPKCRYRIFRECNATKQGKRTFHGISPKDQSQIAWNLLFSKTPQEEEIAETAVRQIEQIQKDLSQNI